MSDVAYDGIFGFGESFTFTPTTGTSFGTAQAQVEEITLPDASYDTAKLTPISGPNSNLEQEYIGKVPTGTTMVKATYGSTEHAAALVCWKNKVKGALTITHGNGDVDSYSNVFLKNVKPGVLTASGLRTDELTFTTPASPTFTAGTSISITDGLEVLSSGAVTLDMTASPISGGTKTPAYVCLLNPATNANAITIAVGATNGYTGFSGPALPQTLAPGASVTLRGTTALSSTNKTLDITGTGAQSLIYHTQLQ